MNQAYQCPFCSFDDVQIDEVRQKEFAVICPECEAIGPIKASITTAVDAWNSAGKPTEKGGA